MVCKSAWWPLMTLSPLRPSMSVTKEFQLMSKVRVLHVTNTWWRECQWKWTASVWMQTFRNEKVKFLLKPHHMYSCCVYTFLSIVFLKISNTEVLKMYCCVPVILLPCCLFSTIVWQKQWLAACLLVCYSASSDQTYFAKQRKHHI